MGREAQVQILFVDSGDIMRAPAAEAIFSGILADNKFSTDLVSTDSCGTGGGSDDWYMSDGVQVHQGVLISPKVVKAVEKRGYKLSGSKKSRHMVSKDLKQFDYIIAMDNLVLDRIQYAADVWIGQEHKITGQQRQAPKDYQKKLSVMGQYLSENYKVKQIPDPEKQKSEEKGIEQAVEMLEDAAMGLLDILKERIIEPTE